MKSKPYKLNGKCFRYDFDHSTVEYIQEADAETIIEEENWKERHNGNSIYGIDDDGYMVLETIGLNQKNWTDLYFRKEYLLEWCYELETDIESITQDFIRYELPYYLEGESNNVI